MVRQGSGQPVPIIQNLLLVFRKKVLCQMLTHYLERIYIILASRHYVILMFFFLFYDEYKLFKQRHAKTGKSHGKTYTVRKDF